MTRLSWRTTALAELTPTWVLEPQPTVDTATFPTMVCNAVNAACELPLAKVAAAT